MKKTVPAPPSTPPPAAALGELRQIPVKEIVPCPQNRKHFDPAKLEELTANVRQHGVRVPVLVRPLPVYELQRPGLVSKFWRVVCLPSTTIFEGDERAAIEALPKTNGARFELVAGERRWRASQGAGRNTIPAIVSELSDREAREVRLLENLQREDLSALEEAEAYREMIDSGDYTAETLAEKLNKSRSHLFERLRLTRLHAPLRKAVLDGRLLPTVAAKLAQIPDPAKQEDAMEAALGGNRYGNGDPMSFREVKDMVEREYTASLKTPPFDPKDATLPGGPCAACPKRSGNLKTVFPDIGSPDVCTDVQCFGRKREITTTLRLDAARKSGQKVLSAKEYDRVRYTSAYVNLDETCYSVESGKSWRTLLKGSGITPILAVDDRNENAALVELLPKEAAYAALKKLGVKVRESGSNDYERRARAEQKVKKARRAAQTSVREAVMMKIVDAAESNPLLVGWRLVASLSFHALTDEAAELLVKRRAIAHDDEPEAAVARLINDSDSAAELRGLAVEILTLRDWLDHYSAKWGGAIEVAAKFAGLDLEQLTQQALAANNKEKPHAKKTKVKQ